jgi:hypothetical protein
VNHPDQKWFFRLRHAIVTIMCVCAERAAKRHKPDSAGGVAALLRTKTQKFKVRAKVVRASKEMVPAAAGMYFSLHVVLNKNYLISIISQMPRQSSVEIRDISLVVQLFGFAFKGKSFLSIFHVPTY